MVCCWTAAPPAGAARQLPDISLVVMTNSLHIIQTRPAPTCAPSDWGASIPPSMRILSACWRADAEGVRDQQAVLLPATASARTAASASNEHHARLKQQMLLASERKFLLVDSNKFGRRSFARIATTGR
ncbi:hypothetical protein M8494_26210 [Serratia ureilytica]